MADTKISNLTALAATPDNGDWFAVVDVSAGETKKLDAKYIVGDSGGSGAIVTGAYTLTLPATGTAALLATANVFTVKQTIVTGTSGITLDIPNQALGSIIFANNAGSNAVPTIAGKSNDSVGLVIMAATNDGNTGGDFRFDVRENDGSDFATLTSPAFRFDRYGTRLLTILRNGYVLSGTSTDSGGQLQVKQASTTAAIPVLRLEQSDDDIAFIDYVGTTAASAANSLSSWTTGNTVQGHIRIRINGTTRWVRFYDAPTS